MAPLEKPAKERARAHEFVQTESCLGLPEVTTGKKMPAEPLDAPETPPPTRLDFEPAYTPTPPSQEPQPNLVNPTMKKQDLGTPDDGKKEPSRQALWIAIEQIENDRSHFLH